MKQQTPYFTVALTTYNRADLLVGALQSVMAQTFTDYELLIIDDASPDHTPQVVNDFMAEVAQQPDAPTITYLRLPQNGGAASAHQAGWQRTRSEFVVYLEDDDRFTPDFLAHMHQALHAAPPSVAFAVPGRSMFQVTATETVFTRQETFGYRETTLLPGSRFFERATGGASGLAVRVAAIGAAGGWPQGIKCGSDIDLMMHMAINNDYLIVPHAMLHVYNLDQAQVTHNLYCIAEAQERLTDQYADQFRRMPTRHAHRYRQAARKFYSIRARREGRRCMWKAFKVNPFFYKTWGLFPMLELFYFLPLTLRRHLYHDPRHGYLATQQST